MPPYFSEPLIQNPSVARLLHHSRSKCCMLIALHAQELVVHEICAEKTRYLALQIYDFTRFSGEFSVYKDEKYHFSTHSS